MRFVVPVKKGKVFPGPLPMERGSEKRRNGLTRVPDQRGAVLVAQLKEETGESLSGRRTSTSIKTGWEDAPGIISLSVMKKGGGYVLRGDRRNDTQRRMKKKRTGYFSRNRGTG